MATLKVYRTSTGFHDAYVAAPSQKAALKAWGSEHNLFARGVAEIVTDPELTREPLANPGTVIKRSRGSAAEQFAALPPDKPRRAGVAEVPPAEAKPLRKAKPKPRPDRHELDEAEAAITATGKRHEKERVEIDKRIAALEKERAALLKTQRSEISADEAARDDAATAYDKAMRAWRG